MYAIFMLTIVSVIKRKLKIKNEQLLRQWLVMTPTTACLPWLLSPSAGNKK